MEFLIMTILSNALIISILFYSKIYIELIYRRKDSNDDLWVKVSMFHKLLNYDMQIPIIEIKNMQRAVWLKSKIKTQHSQQQTKEKREQRFIRKTLHYYLAHPGRLQYVLRLFRYCARLYLRIIGNITIALHCENFNWQTKYGAKDAALTGIVTGILWTIKSLILSRVQRKAVFESKPHIHVTPDFEEDDLKVDFQCIFSIRLGNVITTIRNLYVIK